MAGSTSVALATRSKTASEWVILPSLTLFRRLSTAQPSSPISEAPTIRPLPLRVWKPRLTSANASALLGSLPQTGSSLFIVSRTSRASSVKISSISGSRARSGVADAGGGEGSAVGVKGGSGAGISASSTGGVGTGSLAATEVGAISAATPASSAAVASAICVRSAVSVPLTSAGTALTGSVATATCPASITRCSRESATIASTERLKVSLISPESWLGSSATIDSKVPVSVLIRSIFSCPWACASTVTCSRRCRNAFAVSRFVGSSIHKLRLLWISSISVLGSSSPASATLIAMCMSLIAASTRSSMSTRPNCRPSACADKVPMHTARASITA